MKKSIVFGYALLALFSASGILLTLVRADGVAASATCLTLEDCIAKALEGNPEVEILKARLDESKAREEEVAAEYWPRVTMVERMDQTDIPSRIYNYRLDQRDYRPDLPWNNLHQRYNYHTGVESRMLLYDGGKRFWQKQVESLNGEALKASVAELQNALVAGISRQFYEALALDRVIALREAGLRQARKRGDASPPGTDDPAQSIRLAEAEEAVLTAKARRDGALAGLRVLLGKEHGEKFSLARRSREIQEPEVGVGLLIVEAEHNRPELRRLAILSEMREREIDAQKGAYLPEVSATASYGFDDENHRLNHDKDNWALGLGMEWNIFEGLGTRRRVEQSEQRLKISQAEEKRARLRVQSEVEDAYQRYRVARDRLRLFRRALTGAARLRRRDRGTDRAGESEAAWRAWRERLILTRFEHETALLHLYQAIGVWEADVMKEPQPRGKMPSLLLPGGKGGKMLRELPPRTEDT